MLDITEQAARTFAAPQLGLRNEARVFLEAIRSSTKPPEFKTHPLGFIHAGIGTSGEDTYRLHIWPSTRRTAQQPWMPIHDHCFSLHSRVLLGQITNRSYQVKRDSDGHAAVFEVCYDIGSSVIRSTAERVAARLRSEHKYGPGESYIVARGSFHESVVDSGILTVTLVRATGVTTNSPRVLGPVVDSPTEYRFARGVCAHHVVAELLESTTLALGA